MHPSGSTAVASMVSRAAPERARWPRWIRCQSVMQPLTAEYWHIGAMTMRLRSERPPTFNGSNRQGPLMDASSARLGSPLYLTPSVAESLPRAAAHLLQRLGDAKRRTGTGVHTLQIAQQVRKAVEHPGFIGPVQRVGEHKVGYGDGTPDDELACREVHIGHPGHRRKVVPRALHLRGQTLFLRIQGGVFGDPPQRLLELGGGKKEPSIDGGFVRELPWEQVFFGILLGQVERNGHRLRQYQFAIDEDGHLTGRIEFEKCRTAVLSDREIHAHGLERYSEFLQDPAWA